MNGNNLELMDLLNIISFIIGVLNYEENLTQTDKQDLMGEVDSQMNKMLSEIHNHLAQQDALLKELVEAYHDQNKKASR